MDFENLHQVLRDLYSEMMPLCGDMVGIAKGIAGLGALFYVASRVWQSLSRAEEIDVYPLLRPFAIGFCILFFSTAVLGTLNSVLSPPHFLPDSVGNFRADSFCHKHIRRIPIHHVGMDFPLRWRLSVATRIGFVQHHACQNSNAYDRKRH